MAKYVAVVIVFLLLLYYLSRYLVKQKRMAGRTELAVEETIRLGTDSFVYVLSYKGKKYVIAQNKQSIVLVDSIAGEDAAGDTGFEELIRRASDADSETV